MTEELRKEKSLIVCATVRTGSTMIYDDLRAILGLSTNHGEILVKTLFRGAERMDFRSAWRYICEQNMVQSLVLHKVNFHQVASISRAIESGEPVALTPDRQFDPKKYDAFWRFFSDSFWVHVQRKDVFAQAVSRYIANVSGVWHARDISNGTIENYSRSVQYDFDELAHVLKYTYLEREQWNAFFAHYGVAPILIEYEHAVDNFPTYWQPTLDATGLSPKMPMLERRKRKLNNEKNIELKDKLLKDTLRRINQNEEDSVLLKSIYESSIHC